jgi:putative flippase GtrA
MVPPPADSDYTRLGALRRRWPNASQLALFCGVGATAMAVDHAAFVPLVHFGVLDARLAAVVGYLVSSGWSYWLNWRVTFERAPVPSHLRACGAFLLVGAGGAAVRVGVMHLLMVTVAWSRPPEVYLASFVGIVVGTAVNFLGARFWAFRTSP